jgi:hypothetical protein
MERQHSVPVSRQTFLKGMVAAAAAGTRSLRTMGSPARRVNPARSAYPYSGQLASVTGASVTVDLSHVTGKTIQTAPDLQVLAAKSGPRFSIQLVNYNLHNEQSVTISVKGRMTSSPVVRWELSANYPNGHVSTTDSITRVPIPPQSIVILSG